ncbi:1-(5-phosphoribosyl)-5-[(5-phosphoribosylamino)methylideneamino]imidazole-4-carboxamide isomerase [Lysobacter niastensis]|uniref:1-(5-phosphoribosyl)-5-[(5-phosphoribosylamino)methylideneamino] imidazole-4-carboxamide isomerase n=1 Tax=Lysobacter niastensis TaxID=380629 RepID=A0ABS0B4E4_9GAMM|nr:1-(5-phosphoribosyl)-5-[(5-phosphoribosylamino)methylideneamino]imidazole-4-carboxamide isomerase [Lysobacter niastensis]MBF6023486.1 1-(5-phosphoribosyl)-5-[(5-phosphoribosylamino)methylideneamino]imidazole-4-carboxamide isomerase [Lysobacter niastensis]
MSGCILYPAIDVRDGRVVRLRQGDYEQETRYPESPLATARRYADAGADWLHLVDLDAARSGGYTLAPLLAAIRADTPLRVQTGGGVRGESDVEAILQAGADRVVVGSLAVRDPERVAGWIRDFGAERITVALDARQDEQGIWRLPVAGWTQDSDRQFGVLVRGFADAGLRHMLCTDIARDGMLTGPNADLYRALTGLAPEVEVQASGGIRGVEDIRTVQSAGCRGAVLGKGLLEGRFTLEQALEGAVSC